MNETMTTATTLRGESMRETKEIYIAALNYIKRVERQHIQIWFTMRATQKMFRYSFQDQFSSQSSQHHKSNTLELKIMRKNHFCLFNDMHKHSLGRLEHMRMFEEWLLVDWIVFETDSTSRAKQTFPALLYTWCYAWATSILFFFVIMVKSWLISYKMWVEGNWWTQSLNKLWFVRKNTLTSSCFLDSCEVNVIRLIHPNPLGRKRFERKIELEGNVFLFHEWPDS